MIDAVNGDGGNTVVSFQNVGLRYGTGPEILHDISFSLGAGGFYFLSGPSGAGKTSLLRLMYLALEPTRGLITLFGHDTATTSRPELPALRRRIGVVFQDFRLLPHLTAFDNVALPLRIAGHSEGDVRRHVIELLAWVGLREHMQARPKTLSGGQQQLLAIARAVIGRPNLLLADEPTGNVDDRVALRLMYLFEELNRLGTTVVIATHNRSLIERFRHPGFWLEGGRLQPAPAPAGGASRAAPLRAESKAANRC